MYLAAFIFIVIPPAIFGVIQVLLSILSIIREFISCTRTFVETWRDFRTELQSTLQVLKDLHVYTNTIRESNVSTQIRRRYDLLQLSESFPIMKRSPTSSTIGSEIEELSEKP